VLHDGLPARSCLMFAVQATGHTIETSRAWRRRGQLHRCRKRSATARLQCGYCTGILMTMKSFWNRTPILEAQIREALSGNLCPATGYHTLSTRGPRRAQGERHGKMSTRYFGQPVKRNEDARLLTGAALFVDDVELNDMLHAPSCAAVRHAKIFHRRCRRKSAPRRDRRLYAEDLGAYWQHGPLLVPARRSRHRLQPAHPGAAGEGQGTPCREPVCW